MTDTTKDKGRAGRPRLPDPESPLAPPKSRLSSRVLSARDLEARRYAERSAKREYRQAVREGRNNPRSPKTGEDGLRALRDQVAETNIESRKLQADLCAVQSLRVVEQLELAQHRAELAQLRRRQV